MKAVRQAAASRVYLLGPHLVCLRATCDGDGMPYFVQHSAAGVLQFYQEQGL